MSRLTVVTFSSESACSFSDITPFSSVMKSNSHSWLVLVFLVFIPGDLYYLGYALKNNIYSFNLALVMDSFCFTDEDFVGSPGFFRSWRVETLRYPVLWMTSWSCFHIVQAMWCTIMNRVGSKSDDKSYSCGG